MTLYQHRPGTYRRKVLVRDDGNFEMCIRVIGGMIEPVDYNGPGETVVKNVVVPPGRVVYLWSFPELSE